MLPPTPQSNSMWSKSRARPVGDRRVEGHTEDRNVVGHGEVFEASEVWEVREGEGAGIGEIGLLTVFG